jgi:hypothetical protein
MFTASRYDLLRLCRLFSKKRAVERKRLSPVYFWTHDGIFFAGAVAKNHAVRVRLDDGTSVKPIQVEADQLMLTLKGISDSEIILNPTGKFIAITSTFGTDTCPAVSAEIPSELVESLKWVHPLVLDAEAVEEIREVSRFIENEGFKEYLLDTCIRRDKRGMLIGAGTGGIYAASETPASVDGSDDILLEPEVCRIVLPAITSGGTFAVEGGIVSVEGERWRCRTHKIDRGKRWPKLHTLLDRQNNIFVEILREPLLAAVQAILSAGTPSSKAHDTILMSLSFMKNLSVDMKGPFGFPLCITRTVRLDHVIGEMPLTFACNAELLEMALKFLKDERLRLEFVADDKPMVIRAARQIGEYRRTAIVADRKVKP